MPDDTKPQTAVAQKSDQVAVVDEGIFFNLMDSARFAQIQRVGRMFANSQLVPEHFRGAEADCIIAVEMAMRLKLHPFNLMQSLYVVHGKPGIEAKMVIALINASGLFRGPLQFKLTGEAMARQCTAFATYAKTNQVCETTVTMAMAKAEGWLDKAGSKWKTLPDLMLQYRSASFFGRLYCPEVLFGMQSTEELHDVAEVEVNPAPRRQSLREKVGIVEAETVNKDTGEIMGGQVHQEPTGAAQPPAEASAPAEAAKTPPKAPKPAAKADERPIPFVDVMAMLKKARNREQGEVVIDTLNDKAYTEEERREAYALFDERFPKEPVDG